MSATHASRLSGLAGRTEGYRLALARIGLPAWFVVIDLLWIVKPITFAIDARHYQRAADAWLAGGDPWAVFEQGVQFAAGPHTLLFYAPTSLVALPASVAAWMLAGVLAAAWTVRRLGLPWWWFAFPPLFHAIWNGNPQTVMLALLVLGTPVASALAAGIKLYAGVQLLFRPRHLVVAGIALAATALVVPWQLYLASGGGAAEHLSGAWNGSAWRVPVLLLPTAIGLWVLRRHGGEWWSIPAVWPGTQFYYVSTVLPAVARRPVLAALTAIPVPLMVPGLVIAVAGAMVVEERWPGRVPPAVRRALAPDDAAARPAVAAPVGAPPAVA
jgi:hypothetical protein